MKRLFGRWRAGRSLSRHGNSGLSLPIQFVRAADMTEEQQAALLRGLAIVREQQDVSNCGWMHAQQVIEAVSARIPFVFNGCRHE